MNITGGMFSSSSGTLFSGPRNNATSSSWGLQLSSNSPFDFNDMNQYSKTGTGQISGMLPQMSATALLQKAARIGATASNNINSTMMQKSFVNSMAGPIIQGPNNSYENLQTQPNHTSLVEINHLPQKGPQDVGQMFGSGPASLPMSDMGIFSDNLMGGGEHHEENVIGRNPIGPSRFGGSVGVHGGGDDMLTVDFLGIEGSKPPNLDEQLQQQQRMQMMNLFQEEFPHGDSP